MGWTGPVRTISAEAIVLEPSVEITLALTFAGRRSIVKYDSA
jgi:hypothetical protein